MARRARKNQEVTLGRRQRRRKEQRRKNVKEVIGTILYLVILCTIVYFILHYVGQRTVVRGDSMDTTLSDGQNLIMDKLSYRFHEPERYDIVIFPGPEEYGEHPYYIKRIIGLPGETVQIKKGKVYINGKKLKAIYTALRIISMRQVWQRVRKNLVRMSIFVWEITVLSVMTAAMRRSVRYTVHKLLVRYG